jgi:hypothetical protein
MTLEEIVQEVHRYSYMWDSEDDLRVQMATWAARLARREAIEECANRCSEWSMSLRECEKQEGDVEHSARYVVAQIEDAIRSLLDRE